MKKRMKKGKITMIITIGISCFALVLVMFMQFKIVNETDITSIENMREAELRTELANWKSKYEETNQKCVKSTVWLYCERSEADYHDFDVDGIISVVPDKRR